MDEAFYLQTKRNYGRKIDKGKSKRNPLYEQRQMYNEEKNKPCQTILSTQLRQILNIGGHNGNHLLIIMAINYSSHEQTKHPD